MVTDTVTFRYPHYHSIDDSLDKLDFDKAARVRHSRFRRSRNPQMILLDPTHTMPHPQSVGACIPRPRDGDSHPK
jgi:hypothetical protein